VQLSDTYNYKPKMYTNINTPTYIIPSSDKIKMMNNAEINELKSTLKVRSFEGPIEYLLD
jgi:hypothetical protein